MKRTRKTLAPSASERPTRATAACLFLEFDSLAIAANRGPLFVATLMPGKGGVNATNNRGLWATDFSGHLRLLFRTHDTIGEQTLKNFSVLSGTVGSAGVTRSFNDQQKVVWLATFMKNEEAIVVTDVP